MDGDRFDSLTRALGAGRSRRSVLKGLGAAAFGAIGLNQAGKASAANGGNSACAHFCKAVFPPGPQRGECVSAAAHGTGTCAACGASPANYCNGACTNVSTDVNNCGACGISCDDQNACTTDTCVAGVCQHTAAAAGSPCPGGVCFSGTCCAPNEQVVACAGKCGTQTNNCGQSVDCGACSACTLTDLTCTSGVDRCSGDNCYCRPSTEGTTFCGPGIICGTYGYCASSTDCAADQHCALNTCCGRASGTGSTCCPLTGGVCAPNCGASTVTIHSAAIQSGDTTPPS